jgi:acetyltransferase
VLVHKSNIGESSRTIAGSHTAALMNDDAVVDAAFKQAGALRTSTLRDTVAKIKAFLLPPLKGDRVVVVSRSGGHAIIAADECGRAGLTFPKLPREFLETVRRTVRAGVIRLGNPLDVGDLFDIDAYLTIMNQVMALPHIDGVVFLFVMLSTRDTHTLERLVDKAAELTKQHDKPLALVLHTWADVMAHMKGYSAFPIFETAEEAVQALAAGRDWLRFKKKAPRRTPAVRVHPDAATLFDDLAPGAYLTQDQAFALLDLYGIQHPPVALARTAAEAAQAFAKFGGGSVAMKIESPDVVHKTDVGGVMLNLATARDVRAAFGELQAALAEHDPNARFSGALVMPMARRGVELITGVKRDPSFGPVLLLGWGGTAAEAMEKVSLRLAPVTHGEALQMIDELPGQRLLAGFRRRPPVNRHAVADLLVRLGQLAFTPGVGEIDLNPIAAYPDGVLALDARVRKPTQ